MQRCLQLAKNALGNCYPNPMVGSVIVHNGKIIGEGWHQKAGEGHAEVNAIASVQDKSLLVASTLYVNLEPCSHFGKTPPCSDLIVASKIPKVVIGIIDSHSKVCGAGILKLQNAGVEVELGVLESECYELNKRFFTFHNKSRPYIILKWAQSQDGFIAPDKTQRETIEPVWISSSISRQLVHKWRTEEQAILIGTNTALDDNPSLSARDYKGKSPIKILLDRQGIVASTAAIFDSAFAKTIVITQNMDMISVEGTIVETVTSEDLLSQLLAILRKHNILSLIVEGGKHTLQTFIDLDLWDEARIFEGQLEFSKGINAPNISGKLKYSENILSDKLSVILNSNQSWKK